MFLTPLIISPAPIVPRPGVPYQHPRAGLGSALGALQRRVQRLQQRQERHQAQLRALEELGQQLRRESLLTLVRRNLLHSVSAA